MENDIIKQTNNSKTKEFLEKIVRKNPHEPEFVQAIAEVGNTIIPYLDEAADLGGLELFERLCEPERILIFRVPWLDDEANFRISRGYRVQMNSAIGPYKGGTRFHPSVNLSILKFLAFEQVFKNSLTGLPLGAGKGGADFDPKGKSDHEIMKFCQSYITELSRHVGEDKDIPAGDVGVGSREIGYMFGQYKRLNNSFDGTLTGKALEYGGIKLRPEATGYGNVYFAREMLKEQGEDLEGKTCLVSGSGNVAIYTTKKLMALGARVLTLSDSGGYIYDSNGMDDEKLAYVKKIKIEENRRIEAYAKEFDCEYHDGEKPWKQPADLAFPSATQNEIDEEDAKNLVNNGCYLVSEGANMPSTGEAIKIFRNAGILFGPAKAANAGGVAVSGLEMTQNAVGIFWEKERVNDELEKIMKQIHEKCKSRGKEAGRIDYVKGANIAGYERVARAMVAQGLV